MKITAEMAERYKEGINGSREIRENDKNYTFYVRNKHEAFTVVIPKYLPDLQYPYIEEGSVKSENADLSRFTYDLYGFSYTNQKGNKVFKVDLQQAKEILDSQGYIKINEGNQNLVKESQDYVSFIENMKGIVDTFNKNLKEKGVDQDYHLELDENRFDFKYKKLYLRANSPYQYNSLSFKDFSLSSTQEEVEKRFLSLIEEAEEKLKTLKAVNQEKDALRNTCLNYLTKHTELEANEEQTETFIAYIKKYADRNSIEYSQINIEEIMNQPMRVVGYPDKDKLVEKYSETNIYKAIYNEPGPNPLRVIRSDKEIIVAKEQPSEDASIEYDKEKDVVIDISLESIDQALIHMPLSWQNRKDELEEILKQQREEYKDKLSWYKHEYKENYGTAKGDGWANGQKIKIGQTSSIIKIHESDEKWNLKKEIIAMIDKKADELNKEADLKAKFNTIIFGQDDKAYEEFKSWIDSFTEELEMDKDRRSAR